MAEDAISDSLKTKHDWIEIFETMKRGIDRLKKDKIVCEERISKADKEISRLVEKKQPDVVKLEAINEMLQRLSNESNEVEKD